MGNPSELSNQSEANQSEANKLPCAQTNRAGFHCCNRTYRLVPGPRGGRGGASMAMPGLMGKGKSEAELQTRGVLFVCTKPESELRPKLPKQFLFLTVGGETVARLEGERGAPLCPKLQPCRLFGRRVLREIKQLSR